MTVKTGPGAPQGDDGPLPLPARPPPSQSKLFKPFHPFSCHLLGDVLLSPTS